MTPEEAARLLDELAEEEKENLEELARRAEKVRTPTREKDW